jgi:hypothetical protein
MKTFLMVVAVLVFAGGLAARVPQQGKPEQKPEKKVAPTVAGKWAMTLEISMGTGTPTLDLKQDGEKIAGTYTGRYGTFPLEGSLKERAIRFSFTMTAEGQSVEMSFTGEVAEDGQTMKGTAVLGELGDATWNAKREKSADRF